MSKNIKHLHILTLDDCFFFVNENLLRTSSRFFEKLCRQNKSAGTHSYPIYLQEINGCEFEKIIQYIKCQRNLAKKINLNKKQAPIFFNALQNLQIDKNLDYVEYVKEEQQTKKKKKKKNCSNNI